MNTENDVPRSPPHPPASTFRLLFHLWNLVSPIMRGDVAAVRDVLQGTGSPRSLEYSSTEPELLVWCRTLNHCPPLLDSSALTLFLFHFPQIYFQEDDLSRPQPHSTLCSETSGESMGFGMKGICQTPSGYSANYIQPFLHLQLKLLESSFQPEPS